MAIDPKLKKLIDAVTAKRPRRVLDHILKYGFVTTEDLQGKYGYTHGPRAARDVRELGIPLETTRVEGPNGRKIAAYKLGDATAIHLKKGGRQALPRSLKESLVEKDGSMCAVCHAELHARALQIDHRVPYEVGGEPDVSEVERFMLLCGSHNRAKSWSCEHCENWTGARDESVCRTCYWANPAEYEHVARRPIRQLDVTWEGEATGDYARLEERARAEGLPVRELLRRLIHAALNEGPREGRRT